MMFSSDVDSSSLDLENDKKIRHKLLQILSKNLNIQVKIYRIYSNWFRKKTEFLALENLQEQNLFKFSYNGA
jgi:hypothetical protein